MSWGRKVSPGSGRAPRVSPPQRDLPGCGGARGPTGEEPGPAAGLAGFGPSQGALGQPPPRWGVSPWRRVLPPRRSHKPAGCSCRSGGTGTGTGMGMVTGVAIGMGMAMRTGMGTGMRHRGLGG